MLLGTPSTLDVPAEVGQHHEREDDSVAVSEAYMRRCGFSRCRKPLPDEQAARNGETITDVIRRALEDYAKGKKR